MSPAPLFGERFWHVQASVTGGASCGLLSFSRQMAHKLDVKLAVAASAATQLLHLLP